MNSSNIFLCSNSGSLHESKLQKYDNSQSQQGLNYPNNNESSESKLRSKSNSSSVSSELCSFPQLVGDKFDKELKPEIIQKYFSNNEKLSDYISNKKNEGVKLLDECSMLFFTCIKEYFQKKFKIMVVVPEDNLYGDLWMDFTVRELFMCQQQNNDMSIVPSSFLDRKCIDVFRNDYMKTILEKLKKINKE